ncbi:MAG: acyl-CoA thioesterase [Dehalococcoidia bacterium]|nr:acyl-CoA thioesterase [Dehalococcoidia bacterium]MDW8120640.1 thioesterase family protein [Chloroflexota bacterium]
MPKGDFRFHFPLRVRWADCDPLGHVFHGRYLEFTEQAQGEYYRNLGTSIYRLAQKGYFDTIVVKVTAEYFAPALVDDLLDIYTRVSRLGVKSITMLSEIYRQGEERLLCRVEVVYAGWDGAAQRTKPVPEDLRRLISHFEATGEVLPLAQFPNLRV